MSDQSSRGAGVGSASEQPARGAAEPTALSTDRPIRIVLAKLGLDGHDRGLRVVTRMLRDQGFEVIYLGLRQTTEMVVAAATQEDADAVGLSLHNASHMTLAPNMVQALRDTDLDIPVIVGGIIPEPDVQPLLDAGVAAILGPGASATEVAAKVRGAVEAARQGTLPS